MCCSVSKGVLVTLRLAVLAQVGTWNVQTPSLVRNALEMHPGKDVTLAVSALRGSGQLQGDVFGTWGRSERNAADRVSTIDPHDVPPAAEVCPGHSAAL